MVPEWVGSSSAITVSGCHSQSKRLSQKPIDMHCLVSHVREHIDKAGRIINDKAADVQLLALQETVHLMDISAEK